MSLATNTIIYPINGPKLWQKSQQGAIQPPLLKRDLGRPKKKRIRNALMSSQKMPTNYQDSIQCMRAKLVVNMVII